MSAPTDPTRFPAAPFFRYVWATGLLLAAALIAAEWIRAFGRPDWAVAGGTILGRDFANLYAGGHAVLAGELGRVYDRAAFEAFQASVFDGAVTGHNYSYPPISFLYVWLFALLPYGWAYAAWTGLTGGAFLIAARPYLKAAGLPALLALLMPAAAVNAWAGHYGFLIGALWLGAWRLIDRRPLIAGVLIGLMAVKPHLAVLMPLLLLRRGSFAAFGAAAATLLALVAVSAALFGLDPWRAFLADTLGYQASLLDETDKFFATMMPTIVPSLLLAGAPAALAWTVQLLAAGGAVGWLLARLPADPMRAGLAAATATFLVLPYAFNYDLTVVGIAALVALAGSGEADGPARRIALACAFLLPLAQFSFGALGLPLAPLLLLFLLSRFLAPPLGDTAPAPLPYRRA
jgi:alpha-1,2-mannosyltransferase